MYNASEDPRYVLVSNTLVTIRMGDQLDHSELLKMFEALEELTKSFTNNGQTSREVTALLLETTIAFSNALDLPDDEVRDAWEMAYAQSMDRIIEILTR